MLLVRAGACVITVRSERGPQRCACGPGEPGGGRSPGERAGHSLDVGQSTPTCRSPAKLLPCVCLIV